jgi:hypothetical protein
MPLALTLLGALLSLLPAWLADSCQVVSGLSDEQRCQLLRFWTGISHLPAAGFPGLGRKLQLMAAGPPGIRSGTADAADGEDDGEGEEDAEDAATAGDSDGGSDGGSLSEGEEEAGDGSDSSGEAEGDGSAVGRAPIDTVSVLLRGLRGQVQSLRAAVNSTVPLQGVAAQMSTGLLRTWAYVGAVAGSFPATMTAAAAEAAAQPHVQRELQAVAERLQQLRQRAALVADQAAAASWFGNVGLLEQVMQQVAAAAGAVGLLGADGVTLSLELVRLVEQQLQMQLEELVGGGQQQQQQQVERATAEAAAPAPMPAAAPQAAGGPLDQAPAAAAAAGPVQQEAGEQGSGSHDLGFDIVMADAQQQEAAGDQDATAAAAEQAAAATTSEVGAAAAGEAAAASAAAAAAARSGGETGSTDKTMEDAPAPAAATTAAAAAGAASAAEDQQQQQQLPDGLQDPQHSTVLQLLGELAAEDAPSNTAAAAARLQRLQDLQGLPNLPGPLRAGLVALQHDSPPFVDWGVDDEDEDNGNEDGPGEQQASDAAALPAAEDAPALQVLADAAHATQPAAAVAGEAALQPAAAEQPAAANADAAVAAAPPEAGRAKVLQLPRAHTCFMQLLLPTSYADADEMRAALLVALGNVDYFGMA